MIRREFNKLLCLIPFLGLIKPRTKFQSIIRCNGYTWNPDMRIWSGLHGSYDENWTVFTPYTYENYLT